MNLGHLRARDFIPRILDILIKYTEDVKDVLKEKIQLTPNSYFLKWINQIVTLVNQRESEYLKEKIVKLIDSYP